MQRRAAAAYVAFFLVLAAGAYGFMTVTHAPSVTVENPDYALEQNQTFSVGERTYRVTEISAETSSGGGGHGGGGGGTTHTLAVAWTNESARHTATWQNNSTVSYQDDDWRVLIANTSDPGQFRLREEPGNGTETVRRNGTTYVIVEEGDDTFRRVPIGEYEGLNRTVLEEGSEYEVNGNTTTLVNITSDRALFEWTFPTPEVTEAENNGANVTLNGRTFTTHFPSDSQAYLTSDVDGYYAQLHDKELFHERMAGVWSISALGGLAAILLTGLAYLPRKE